MQIIAAQNMRHHTGMGRNSGAKKNVDISVWDSQRLLPQCLTALLSYCQKLSHSEMFQDRTIFSIVASVLTQMQVTERWGGLIMERCYDS